MRRILMLLLLTACGDDAPARPDAQPDSPAIDAPAAPAIDWAIWGGQCDRPSFGIVTCTATDGVTHGLCILTGMCEPGCLSQPGHATECPADGMRTESTAGDGCWCKER